MKTFKKKKLIELGIEYCWVMIHCLFSYSGILGCDLRVLCQYVKVISIPLN